MPAQEKNTNPHHPSPWGIAFDISPVPMLILRDEGLVIEGFNHSAGALLHLKSSGSDEELSFTRLIMATELPDVIHWLRAGNRELRTPKIIQFVSYNNDLSFWASVLASPMEIENSKSWMLTLELDNSSKRFPNDRAVSKFPGYNACFDLSGNVQYMTPNWSLLLGYSLKNLYQSNLFDLMHKESLDSFRLIWEKMTRDQSPLEATIRLANAGDQYISLDVKASVLDNEVLLSGMDVTWQHTENQLINTQLESSERNELLQTIFQLTPLILFWKDRDLVFRGANQMFAHNAGFTNVKEVVGLTDYEMPWKRHASKVQREEKEILRSGKPQIGVEDTYVDDQGKQHSIVSSRIPLVDKEGNITGLFGTYEDISRRKEMESAIASNEKFMRKLLQLLDEALEIEGQHQLYKFMGDHLLDLFGADRLVINSWHVDQEAADELFNAGDLSVETDGLLSELEDSFARMVIDEGQMLFLEDIRSSELRDLPDYEKLPIQSILGMPIVRGEHESGVIIFEFQQTQQSSLTFIDRVNITSRLLSLLVARHQVFDQLTASERLFRSFIDAAPIGVAGLNNGGEFTLTNNSIEKMFGYADGEMLKLNSEHLIVEEYRSQTLEHFHAVNKDGIAVGEFPLRRKDGTTFWCSLHGVKINDNLFLGFHIDISDMVRAREELNREKSMLMALLNSMPDIVFYKDLEGRYLGGNIKGLEFLRLNLNEALGKQDYDLFSPEMARGIMARDKEMYDAAKPTYHEENHTLHDGSVKVFETMRAPYYSLDGQLIGLLGISRDITERKALEKSVHDNNLLFKSLTEHVPGMLAQFLLKKDGSFSFPYASDSTQEFYGLTPEQLRDNADLLLQTVHPDDIKLLLHSVQESARNLSMWNLEYRVLVKGQLRWVKGNGRPIKTDGGDILWHSYLMDITSRKELEIQLSQSEERFRSVYQNATIGLYRSTSDGRVLMANPALLKMLGYDTLEELQQVDLNDEAVCMQSERSKFIKSIVESGEVVGLETEWIRKDGTHFFVHENAMAINDTSGSLQYIDGSVEDITERKRFMDELNASEEKFRHLAENIDDIIWLRSADNKDLLYLNPAYEKVTGLSIGEAFRNPDAYLNIMALEDRTAFVDHYMAYLKGNEDFDVEYRINRSDNETRWLRAKSFRLKDAAGILRGHVGIASDITRLKEAEISLRETLELEKQLGELKSRFVSMASHEFRTPLATIQAITETLQSYRSKMTSDQMDGRLEKIMDQIDHLKKVITSMLDLSKIQQGRMMFNPVKLEFITILKEIQDNYMTHPTSNHGIVLDKCCNQIHMVADPNLLRQLVDNLLSNAVRYSKEHTTITMCVSSDGDNVSLKVKDEGIGIKEEDIPKLFEPFFRAANVENISGTGLGMSIVKEIVDLHGGKIRVTSELGKGTMIQINLPLNN